jgi:hypothetical protein
VESSWAELKVKGIKKNIVVGCIYRHPKGNVSLFTDDLEKVINKVTKEKKLCYLVGDLNINLLNTSHVPTQNFINTILSHNMIPHITLPTRLMDNSATLIDHILVQYDHSDTHDRITTGNLINDISDHLPNFILVGNKTDNQRQENDRPFIRLMSNNNIKKFKDYLNGVDWDSILKKEDCDKDYSRFIEILTMGYEKWFPLVKLSRKRSKDKKWITKGLKISSNTKNRLYRILSNKYSKDKEAKYLKYKNLYVSLCAKAEANFYHTILQDKIKSLRKLWDKFGPIINPGKANKKSNITKLIQGSDVITDNSSICNTFNDYFVGIGKKLTENIHKNNNFLKYLGIAKKLTENIHKNNNFLKYLGNQNPQTMFLKLADKCEISKIINNLDKTKSDTINYCINPCSDKISEPLSTIINCSFSTGIFPEKLKQAKVIPIHKKKEKYLVGNYRPISLLSILGKIFEKAMHTRLYSFITK